MRTRGSHRKSTTALRKGRIARPVAALAATTLALGSVVALSTSAAAVPSTFEIDGNQTTDATLDWETANPDVIPDPIGNNDNTTFAGGDSEASGWPNWGAGNTGTVSGKADLGNVLVDSEIVEDGGMYSQWLHLGWDRQSGTGTVNYWIELNQKDNLNALNPNRTVGDIRIAVQEDGNSNLQCLGVDTWNGAAWADGQPCAGISDVAVNSQSITDYFSSPNAVNGEIPADQFVEASLNLTDLGIGNLCPAQGFSALNMRTQTGASTNSALKDNASGEVDVPSLCSDLTILKEDEDGTPLAGATFTIDPDPNGGEGPFEFTTGEDGTFTFPEIGQDLWGTEFTVTETAAPDGYLMPAERTQTITVGPAESASLTFVDPLPWEPLTIDVTGASEQFVTRTWENDKQVDGNDTVLLPADQASIELDYIVEVYEGPTVVTDEDRTIELTVNNPNEAPNDAPVRGTLEVDMDGQVCTVDGAVDVDPAPGLQLDFAAGDTVFGVTCPNDITDGTVTATVTWDLGDYPQTQDHVDNPGSAGTGSASDSAEIVVDVTDNGLQAVDVWDDFTNPDLPPVFLGTVDATGSENTTQFPVTQVIEVGLGECVEVTNDGYIVEVEAGADGDRIDSATEVVEVCRENPADLTIFKVDEDQQPLPGATFTISPNPVDPSGDDPLEFSTGENGEYTFSDVVYFGEYTVTETVAPDGYLLPADRDQVVTLAPGDDKSLTFVDPLIWEPLDLELSAEQFVTRTWTNDKQVDGNDSVLLPADQESVQLDYMIEVYESDTFLDPAEDPNRSVTVTVDNPNADPVTGLLDVTLDGAFCTYEGTDLNQWETEFASGANVFMVVCDDPPLFGTVDATVTWDRGDYPQTQGDVDDPDNAGTDSASDSLELEQVTTDNGLPSVDVWDDFTNPDLPPVYLGQVDATGSANTTQFAVTQEIFVPLGECVEVVNDGYIVEVDAGADGDRIDSATEVVEVCREAPADLTIFKVDEDQQPLPGATFTISPNPVDPAGDDPLEFTVDENGEYTFSDVVYFGEYTVTETVAPDGYLLPAQRSQMVTLATGDDKSLTFVDPLAWEPLTVDVTADQFVTRTWTNDKQVDGNDTVLLPADQESVELDYMIDVYESDTFLDPDENPNRSVTVTVNNPNAGTVTGLVDVTIDGAFCTYMGTDLDQWENSFASGDTVLMVECPNPPLFGTVDATVTWELADYPQTQEHIDDPDNAGTDSASDSLDLETVTTDNGLQSVDVWDDFTNPDLPPTLLGTVEATGSANTTTFEFSQVIDVPLGECILVTNDGYIVEVEAGADGDRIDSATEVVEVCREAPADLTIYKEDEEGKPLAGATFEISPNPVDPEGPDPLEFTVDENGEYTFEDVVYFGEYTVTETVAPDGYLLPAQRSQMVTLATGDDKALTFVDPLIWEPLTVDVTADQFVTRTWTNDKQVDGNDTVLLPADQESVELEYMIEVYESDTFLDPAEDPNRSVTVTVNNPNADPVTGLVDVTIDGAFCTYMGTDLDQWENAFASGDTVLMVECPNPPLFGTVDATVTWDRGDYPQTQGDVDDPENAPAGEASDSLDLGTVTTDNGLQSVDVWDDFTNPDLPPTYLGTVDAIGSANTTQFPVTQEIFVPLGECILVTNDGYIVEVEAGADGERIDSATEVVEVCREAPADLTIYKEDEQGKPLAGATFEISPNPVDPEGPDPLEFTVDENGVYVFEDIVYFGEYTVTETVAPDGYLLPAQRSQMVTLTTGDDKALTFVDPLIWEPLDLELSAEQFVTRTWTNDKRVDGEDQILLPADQESIELDYMIEVYESDTFLDPAEDPNRSVTVTVNNPNAGAVTGMLTVELDGAFCTYMGTDLDAWENEFASGDTVLMVECPNPPLFGTVDATVTWDRGDYPQTQGDVDDPQNAPAGEASDSLDLETVTTDNGLPSVDVWDDFTNPDFEPELLGTVEATGSENTTTFPVSQVIEVPLGECVEVVNDGYIVEVDAGAGGDRIDSATEVVEVCREDGADLTIYKEDEEGEPLAGATFEMSPNPTDPESEEPYEFSTGETGMYTFEDVVYFGEYTVTETVAPEGYLLPAQRSQMVTLATGDDKALTFVDPLIWEPLTVDVSADQFVTRTWTNDKQVDGNDTVLLPADQESIELEYTVEVYESDTFLDPAENPNRSVAVTVNNPNAGSVTGLVDVTIDGAYCTYMGTELNQWENSFTSGDTVLMVECPNPPLFGTVDATVTWDRGEYPQTQDDVDDPENAPAGEATDSLDLETVTTDNGLQAVDVWDDFTNPDFEPELLGTVEATGSENTTQFPVTRVIEVPLGECILVVNDGYIVEVEASADGERIDSATEVVEVCREDGADLTIYKEDEEGEPLAGATFEISPNPVDPSGDDPLEFTVDENGMYTFEDVVYFGEYTVTETVAPEGYLLPAQRSQTVTLATEDDKALTFVDPLIWEPLDIDVMGMGEQFVSRTFTVDKEAETHPVTLPADQAHTTVEFTVRVVEGPTTVDDATLEAGSVVSNPNDHPVMGTVEAMFEASSCTITAGQGEEEVVLDGPYSFGPGETALTFTCENVNDFEGTLGATVTWDLGEYPQTQDDVDDPENAGTDMASDQVDIDPSVTDNGPTSVEVWDDFTIWGGVTSPSLPPVLLGTVEASKPGAVTEFPVSTTVMVEQGECLDVTNEAYLLDGDTELDRDSASVEICRDVPVTPPTPPLPRTGADMAMAALAALLLIGTGAGIMIVRRRNQG
ncbi:SpaA isopeptide-forming pilin-related protein [Isoptericola sp. b408]|uniref:SpaA isopeptide-forming pilin-related protein n=1 Tax=Isoptericola sp. b408 TaxID=3064653 RepID=UPI002713DBDE|nr:SpaA isopeptide-forming pilin-related protein [Isoptericola sp. b408]MDO8151654.1 SpaA isopeptide-forming pilin-related protein [Isoptericola sp. b408]